MSTLKTDGFEIIRNVFTEDEIAGLRDEAEVVLANTQSSCIRHLRNKSDVFGEISTSEKVLNLISDGLIPVRSILFDKTVSENWPVAWHQDLTIAVEYRNDVDGYGPLSLKDEVMHVQPPIELLSHMVTVRIHLDDTPESNGALRVIPETHNLGKIPSNEIKFLCLDSVVTCECHSGDVVLMSPLILHSSRRSKLPKRRRIVHFEYARLSDLDSRLK